MELLLVVFLSRTTRLTILWRDFLYKSVLVSPVKCIGIAVVHYCVFPDYCAELFINQATAYLQFGSYEEILWGT